MAIHVLISNRNDVQGFFCEYTARFFFEEEEAKITFDVPCECGVPFN